MDARSATTLGALAVLLLVVGPVGSPAQQPAPPAAQAEPPAAPPAEPPAKNLQVLPKEWTRREVIDRVMKNWTADLGVRCQHCHVGEEGKPFSEWDFTSDAKPEKQTAREMLRMLEEVNRRLASIETLHAHGGAKATCYTCHRGQPHPRRIETVFEDTRKRDGLAAAVAEYRTLRSENLTRGGYDFGSMPLVRLARARLAEKDTATAREVLTLALDVGLDSLAIRSTLADVALADGDRATAVAHLEKALALASNAAEKEFVEQQLRTARGEPEAPER